MMPPAGLRDRVVGNTALLGVVFFFNAVAGVATSILLAHLLTVEALGLYGFWFRVYSWMAALAVFFLPQMLVRFVAELRGGGRASPGWRLLGWAIRVQLLLMLAVLLGVGGLLMARPGLATFPLLLVTLAFALHALIAVVQAYLRGCQAFGPVAMGVMVSSLVRLGGLIVLFLAGADLVSALLVYTVGQVVHLAILVRHLAPPARKDAEEGAPFGAVRARAARFGLTMGAAGLLSLFTWSYMEVFILGWTWAGDARLELELAFYTLAISLCMLPNRFSKAVAGALTPAFATLSGRGDTGRITSSYRTGTVLASAAGAWLSINLAFAAPALFALLFPPTLGASAHVFQILMIPTLLLSMNHAGGVLLPTLDGHRFQLLVSGVGAPIAIVLGLALITPFGARGAASVNAIMQSGCVLASILWLRRARGLPFPLRRVALIVLAALTGALALPFMATGLQLVVGLPLSALVYLLLLRLLGVFGAAEERVLLSCTRLLPRQLAGTWRLLARGVCTS